MVDLKTFLGLDMPNQYFPTVRIKKLAGFVAIFLDQNSSTFMIPIYSTTVKYDESLMISIPPL